MIEALVFASAAPVPLAELARRLPPSANLAAALARLHERYQGRGVEFVRVGEAVAFRTAADLAWLLSDLRVEPRKLSRAALEVLAIIAYHQPITRAEIEAIRGVALSRGTLDVLMELGWVKLGARRETPGRPVTFVTTDAFLDHFGLKSLRDLPGLEELRALGLLSPRAGPLFERPTTAPNDDAAHA